MSKTMTVTDAQLRLDQLKNGRIPSKETPVLENPIYQKAYDGFLRFGALCNTLREGTDGAGGFMVPDEFEKKIIDNRILFAFRDGHVEEHIWKDHSRKDSWNTDKRKKAAEKTRAQHQRRREREAQ